MTGKDILIRLQDAGIKPQSVADGLGIPAQNLYSIFNAKSVKVDTLIDIANAIDRPLSWFFDDGSFTQAHPQDGVTIPTSAWEVICQQARSLERKDEQISEVISILRNQLSKGAAYVDATIADAR